jgi:3-oxoadipate enol-lactonase
MPTWAARSSGEFRSADTSCLNSGAAIAAGLRDWYYPARVRRPTRPRVGAGRLKTADDVLERGAEPFIESMIPRVFSETTLTMCPDLVEQARRMMLKMSPADIAQVQRGMAERLDSIPTLATISVPTLLVMGEEDTFAPFADGELMRQHISGSQLKLIPKAGHFAVWEEPEAVGKLLRRFVDSCH